MKLSETDAGNQWLKKIDLQDQQTAKELLDSLIVVHNDELKHNLSNLLVNVHKNLRKKNYPFAIYVAFEPDIRAFWNKGGVPASPRASKMGSEGFLLNFVRDFCTKHPGYFAYPSLNVLKKHKIRTIVILDDFVGSGTRINNYFRWFFQKKIKSWTIGGFVRFVVISFASTLIGEQNVKQNKYISHVHSCYRLREGRAFWKKQDRERYRMFCDKYFSPNPRNPDDTGTGYKKIFSMLLFEKGMPNNNPQILRKLDVDKLDFSKLDKYGDIRKKYASTVKEELLENNKDLIYRFLIVLKKSRSKNEDRLSDYLEISRIKLEKLINLCKKNKLITNVMNLTSAAQKFIRDNCDEQKQKKEIDNYDEYYYY